MNAEELLLEIATSLQKWDESVEGLKAQIADLQRGQIELRQQLAGVQSPDPWQWLGDCYDRYHKSEEAARQALRSGHYKSGVEYVKVNRRYKLNVEAIDARLAKKQSRRAA